MSDGPHFPEETDHCQIIHISATDNEGRPLEFQKEVEIILPYHVLGESVNAEDVRVYTYVGNRWKLIEDYTVDASREIISIRVGHTSLFTVAVPETFETHIPGGEHTENYRMISFPAHPDDPDLPELLERVAKDKSVYLRWGRDTVGWAIYVFRFRPI